MLTTIYSSVALLRGGAWIEIKRLASIEDIDAVALLRGGAWIEITNIEVNGKSTATVALLRGGAWIEMPNSPR